MGMSKDDFKRAFREVVSSEFANIPCDENSIEFNFSNKFNRKMEKLIKSQKKSYYVLINTASKKVAVICLAVVTLFTASLSVEAIRKPVVNFITEIYETFTKYLFDGDTAEVIQRDFKIKKIPEGFKQIDKIDNEISKIIIYENQKGDILEFTQVATEKTNLFVDNEKEASYTEIINDIEVKFYEANDTKQAVWIQDEYYLDITCYGEIDTEIIIEMIKSVE